MVRDASLLLETSCQIRSQNAGLFVSRGLGTHPSRIITSFELILVKQGRLDIWEAERTFSLDAGQTLLLHPNRQHGGIGTLPKGLEFYWIHFEQKPKKNHSDLMTITIPQVNSLRRPEKLETLFRYFLDCQEAGDLSAESANQLVTLMLIEVGQSIPQPTDAADKPSALAELIRNYVWMRADEKLSAGRIAAELGYNPDYLGRVYRRVYGRTLTHTIHESRVTRACRFLIDSDMTIEEIAQACGFSDSDYFRRVFKRHKLITPHAFRKINSRIYINTH